jgi:cobalamin biosynthesis Mg chelatase CobN
MNDDTPINNMMSARDMNQQGLRPVPDPTFLTTEALQREIKGLGEQLRAELRVSEVESTGGRQAIHIHIEDIQRQISALETFVKERFMLVENARVEQKQDNEKAVQAALLAAEKAVQAALLAQKEAVREQTAASALAISKSESSTAARSAQQYATITAELKAVTDRLGEQGNRLTTIESTKLGASEMRTTQRLDLGSILGLVSIVIVVLSIFANFVVNMP